MFSKINKSKNSYIYAVVMSLILLMATAFGVLIETEVGQITRPTADTWDLYGVRPNTDEYDLIESPEGAFVSPWHIYTANELAWLINNIKEQGWNEIYLEADIDLAGHEWLPIEGNTTVSTLFYGQGHTIRNLKINLPGNETSVGLFKGCGTAQDVVFENVNIKGGNNTGALCGVGTSSSYANIQVKSGFISGNNYVGGIVGYILAGTPKFINCFNNAVVNGNNSVGGILGFKRGVPVVSLENCINTGNIVGIKNVGGLIGRVEQLGSIIGTGSTGPSIKNSYSETMVVGDNNVGGLIGSTNVKASIQYSGFNGELVVNGAYQDTNLSVGLFIGNKISSSMLASFAVAKVFFTDESVTTQYDLYRMAGGTNSYVYADVSTLTSSQEVREYAEDTESTEYDLFAYDPNINGGFPFPRELFAVGKFIECGNIIEYLQGFGFEAIY